MQLAQVTFLHVCVGSRARGAGARAHDAGARAHDAALSNHIPVCVH